MSTEHVSGSYIISGNKNTMITGGIQPEVGAGTKLLLKYWVKGAVYNSRPRNSSELDECFPGTRVELIEMMTIWTTSTIQGPKHHLLWMEGPAGGGKSTIAFSLAKAAASQGTLGASFFFSSEIVQATNFFTMVAYQLSRKISSYRDSLEKIVLEDPTLLSDAGLEAQFDNLIVNPLLTLYAEQPKDQKPGITWNVVIVDGLDLCSDTDARTIIRVIAKSVSVYGSRLPLLWAIFSRSTPNIRRIFDDFSLSHFCWQFELSNATSSEIRTYLKGVLNISQNPDWPSASDLDLLVELADGYFTYAVLIARFIRNRESLSPERQLEELMSFCSYSRWERCHSLMHKGGLPDHPLTRLDEYYRNIMNLIPRDTLPIIQQVLLLHHELSHRLEPITKDLINVPPPARLLASFVGLTLPELEGALAKLYSVLALREPEHIQRDLDDKWGSATIVFCHRSFLEFLLDRERSRGFCIRQQDQWLTLAVRNVSLLVRMYALNGSPRDKKIRDLGDLFSAKPVARRIIFRDELYQHLHERLLNWCAYSGFANTQIVQKLDKNMLQELEMEVNHELLVKFPQEARHHIRSTSHINYIPSLSLKGQFDLIAPYIEHHISSHFRKTLKKQEFQSTERSDLLRNYARSWKAYQSIINLLSLKNKFLEQVALQVWQTSFYEVMQAEPSLRLTKATLGVIERRREGDMLNTHRPSLFIRSLARMNPTGQLGSAPVSVANSLSIFDRGFRRPYINATREFYARESAALLSREHSLLTYLEHVKERLLEERACIAAFDLSNSHEDDLNFMQACTDTLLKDHCQKIYDEFERLLVKNGSKKDFQLILSLTPEIPGSLETLLEIFGTHVKSAMLGSISESTSGEGAAPDFIPALLAVRQGYIEIAESVLEDESRFCQVVDRVLEETVVERNLPREQELSMPDGL
ncbi:hypothetical protein NP233_g11370 [Leucocoprinus birnbaumii]|uniref:NACHT domain-containing protein n=1 Tax=Leucocoprinus birnbaumii TaxID=56174 RepID=A0AAD5VMN2_9AGAR|nr:hypothetical protein NP233_g11370 [Leucocoprinus birnbaumii]